MGPEATRKLLVAVPGLTEAHRSAIRTAAGEAGFAAAFYNDPAEALPAARDAEIIFSDFAELAHTAPKLRWVCTPFAGVNSFTRPETAPAEGAVLTNSSGAYGVTIAEHIMMAALTMLRRQPEYNGIVSRREWTRDLPQDSLFGSRILMLGTGDIGRTAAERLRAFRPARIFGANRSGHEAPGFDRVFPMADLDGLLPETDLLISALPGTPETVHLLNAARLALLPDGALIVNVGRGTLIDQAALEAELRAGRLRAALDVFEAEPIPQDSPLWDCPNLLITPHVAGNLSLLYTRDQITELFLENFRLYCEGKPLKRQVDLKKGY